MYHEKITLGGQKSCTKETVQQKFVDATLPAACWSTTELVNYLNNFNSDFTKFPR